MDFTKPGPNKRVCAFFIDSIIAQIIAGVLSVLISTSITWLVWSIIILFKDCMNGRSAGKYLVGTQILDENGSPAKPSKAILRNLFMIIPFFPLIEYFIMLRDKVEGKRVGDKAAKTKVNDLKPEIKDSTFLWISVALAIVVFVIQIVIASLQNSGLPNSG
jgi:uncharacterized RDD family membrane protein YckC